MRRTTHVLSLAGLALLLLPALSGAQGRKTRGEKEADWDAIAKNGSSGPTISAKDIEGMSPLKAMIDKKKDLKLTDDQLGKFKGFDGALKEKNAPLATMVDSLRKAMKPSVTPTPEDEARAVIARESMMGVLKEVHANNDAAVKEAMALLDETQQKAAAEVLQKEQQDNQEMLRAKLGGRSGSGGPPAAGRRGGSPI
jgi:hypothetical protein